MAIQKGDSLSYPPRGLSHDEAARYVGVSPSKFDQLVADRRMPKPKRVDGRNIWDRVQLDIYFNELPAEKTGMEGQLEASGRKSS